MSVSPLPGQCDFETNTVLQPDLVVVCNPSRVNHRGIRGVPDLVIAIQSPSTAARDQIVKATVYENHAVREYWLLDPSDRLLTVRHLTESGKFTPPVIIEARGRVPVTIFEGLELDFDRAFARIPPAHGDVKARPPWRGDCAGPEECRKRESSACTCPPGCVIFDIAT